MKKKHRFLALMLLPLVILGMTRWAAAEGEMVFLALMLPSIAQNRPGSEECAVGSLTADAARHAADARLAIVNGGDLVGDLSQGDLSRSDVEAAFANDRELAVSRLTAAELRALLETLLSHITVDMQTERIVWEDSDFAGFPNISGFYLSYDATAPANERVVSITLDDGTALDLSDTEAQYSLAATDTLLSGGYGNKALDMSPAGISLSGAVYDYLSRYGRELTELNWMRVTAIGANENNIVGMLPTPILIMGAVLLFAAVMLIGRKRL